MPSPFRDVLRTFKLLPSSLSSFCYLPCPRLSNLQTRTRPFSHQRVQMCLAASCGDPELCLPILTRRWHLAESLQLAKRGRRRDGLHQCYRAIVELARRTSAMPRRRGASWTELSQRAKRNNSKRRGHTGPYGIAGTGRSGKNSGQAASPPAW